jgi:hypothetical protein
VNKSKKAKPTPTPTTPPPEPRVSLRRREELEAAADFDRICASRPLTPPPLRSSAPLARSAGAIELAREIRQGTYTP